MRIDHYAYQRATRVAGLGFLLQLGIGLTLLIFALWGDGVSDTPFLFGSLYVLLGALAWLGLIVVFNQHKLERLEALEEDELGRASESVFEERPDELRVASRRLRLMHKWLMPGLSLAIAAGFALLAWSMLETRSAIAADEAVFRVSESRGWAVALALGLSAVTFIFSRFVAGMAKQPAWQNLRGGAGHMVGISLVTLAIAVGIGFRFFENDDVIRVITLWAIPVYMIVLAAEIALNFLLNIYRPRIPGEVPRPAFDSKLLSLLAAPDNFVRTINEAINYQFGFDITSSWGYQLLIRSVSWLVALGLLALMVLNMLVVVEPHEEAIKLARGRIVGDAPYQPGLTVKLPWPFQTAETYDVTRVRSLHLTSAWAAGVERTPQGQAQLWTDDLGKKYVTELDPFIVRSSSAGAGRAAGTDEEVEAEDGEPGDLAGGPGQAVAGVPERVTEDIALLDAEISIHYRIRPNDGLLNHLDYSMERPRRSPLTLAEQALKTIALREVTQTLSRLRIDDILAGRREDLASRLRERVQAAFDRHETGVELVAVNIPMMRPAGEVAGSFQNVTISHHAARRNVANAEGQVLGGLIELLGDPDRAPAILEELAELRRMRDAVEGAESTPEERASILEQRLKLEGMLEQSGGAAAVIIAEAERNRWTELLDTRAEAVLVSSRTDSYRAAPELFRSRETMIVYGNALAGLYKYILGVDPEQVSFDVDLRELGGPLTITDALESGGETSP